jgi:glutathione S-transferase
VRMLTLYTTPLSANGRKPLAVCHHLGLLPEVRLVNVNRGEGRLGARDAKERAEVARWMFWEASHWQPSMIAVPGLASAVAVKLGIPGVVASPEGVRWEDAEWTRMARYLDGHLEGRKYLVGEELTSADFAMAGMMTYARRTGFPFQRYVGIARWYERVEALEAWKASTAEVWR